MPSRMLSVRAVTLSFTFPSLPMQRGFLETSVLHASHDHLPLFNSRSGISNGFHWLMACDRITDTKHISIRYLRRLSSLSKNDKDIPLLMHVLQIFFSPFQVGSWPAKQNASRIANLSLPNALQLQSRNRTNIGSQAQQINSQHYEFWK